jgi:hypothetical protein
MGFQARNANTLLGNWQAMEAQTQKNSNQT